MEEPESIKPHEKDYHEDAWHGYSIMELAAWVHLLRKRAMMRTDPEKAAKDNTDADNYFAMMQAMLAEERRQG